MTLSSEIIFFLNENIRTNTYVLVVDCTRRAVRVSKTNNLRIESLSKYLPIFVNFFRLLK